MDRILLNHQTERLLHSYLKNPSQGLIIQGPKGSGKSKILNWLGAELVKIQEEELTIYPYAFRPEVNDKGKIPIDSIRQIDHFLSRAVPMDKTCIRRIIIIDDSENLGIEAQNALLKNLEEPPSDTVFLMSSSNPNRLLPTIRSRLTLIRIINPPKDDLIQYLIERGLSRPESEQSVLISGGLTGLAIDIASNYVEHPLVIAASSAREILRANTYQRLALVNELHKHPERVTDMLHILQQMSNIALQNSRGRQSVRWKKVLESAQHAEISLEKRTNLRLTLTHLMLHI